MKFSTIKTMVGLGAAGIGVVLITACGGAAPTETGSIQISTQPDKQPIAIAAVPSELQRVQFTLNAATNETSSANYTVPHEGIAHSDSAMQNNLRLRRALKNGDLLRQGDSVYYYIYHSIIPMEDGSFDETKVIDVPADVLAIYPQRTSEETVWTKLNVNTQAANLRSGPDLDFEIINTINNTDGILVTGRDENSHWLRVKYQGQSGWLAGDLVRYQPLVNLVPLVNPSASVPEQAATPQETTATAETSYVGIGARIGTRNGLPAIEAPFDGAPADRAGLRPGDIILAVDGQKVASLDDIGGRIRGEIGVAVTLTISRPDANQQLDVTIIREEINLLTARAVCVAHPIRGFGEAWDNHPEVRQWLGCPFTNFRQDEHATPAAVQTFERGWMLWLETDTVANVDPIYVFFEDTGSYIRYGDRQLVDAHSYAPTPEGFYKVGDRFAKVYWEEIGPDGRLRLGNATNEARDSKGAFQEFENGRMFWANQSDTIYVIYQGYFDSDDDGQTTWTQSWTSYKDTYEAPEKN